MYISKPDLLSKYSVSLYFILYTVKMIYFLHLVKLTVNLKQTIQNFYKHAI